jgi:hypothetical protein
MQGEANDAAGDFDVAAMRVTLLRERRALSPDQGALSRDKDALYSGKLSRWSDRSALWSSIVDRSDDKAAG